MEQSKIKFSAEALTIENHIKNSNITLSKTIEFNDDQLRDFIDIYRKLPESFIRQDDSEMMKDLPEVIKFFLNMIDVHKPNVHFTDKSIFMLSVFWEKPIDIILTFWICLYKIKHSDYCRRQSDGKFVFDSRNLSEQYFPMGFYESKKLNELWKLGENDFNSLTKGKSLLTIEKHS